MWWKDIGSGLQWTMVWDIFKDTGSQNISALHSARFILFRWRAIIYLFYSTLPSSARVISCKIYFTSKFKEKLLKLLELLNLKIVKK